MWQSTERKKRKKKKGMDSDFDGFESCGKLYFIIIAIKKKKKLQRNAVTAGFTEKKKSF